QLINSVLALTVFGPHESPRRLTDKRKGQDHDYRVRVTRCQMSQRSGLDQTRRLGADVSSKPLKTFRSNYAAFEEENLPPWKALGGSVFGSTSIAHQQVAIPEAYGQFMVQH
ncbi:hypothetical protein BaRGS_00000653, partial [Batillaria attramentaria]